MIFKKLELLLSLHDMNIFATGLHCVFNWFNEMCDFLVIILEYQP